MGNAVIRNGRWVGSNEEQLDPVEMHRVHHQFNRIHSFTNGVVELTHIKIEILSHILNATPEQEKAIVKILKMNKTEIKDLPL